MDQVSPTADELNLLQMGTIDTLEDVLHETIGVCASTPPKSKVFEVPHLTTCPRNGLRKYTLHIHTNIGGECYRPKIRRLVSKIDVELWV